MPQPDMDPLEQYDRDIMRPMIRAYFGDGLFYNVGLWSDATKDQDSASAALVGRLLASAESPRDVLEVGCGLGGTAQSVRRRWPEARVTAINLSERQVERCRRAVPGVDFRVMDATRLDFPDASFDLVLSVEAAFHFDTRADFLREARRVVRPRGTIAIADILLTRDAAGDAVAIWDLQDRNHLADLDAYRDLMRSTGFVDVCVDDITADSWLAWCSAIERWIAENEGHPTVTAKERRNWRDSMPGMRSAVRHYLTAVARAQG